MNVETLITVFVIFSYIVRACLSALIKFPFFVLRV